MASMSVNGEYFLSCLTRLCHIEAGCMAHDMVVVIGDMLVK